MSSMVQDHRHVDTDVAQVTGGRLSTARRLGLSVLATAAALAVATHGTGASFTASASRGHMITTGNPALVLGATSAATNRLGIDVTGLSPGDSAFRSFDLTNAGTHPFTSMTFASVATVHSLLDTDTANGLKVMLERCSAAWTENGTQPQFTYTCSGTRTTVVPSSPIIQSATGLSGMAAAAAGGTDHLLLTETLPSIADNTFQNLSSAVTFTFNAA